MDPRCEPPDVVFISSNSPDYAAIIGDLRAAGIEAAFLGGDAMDTAEFYESLGAELGRDIFISTHSFIGAETGPEPSKDAQRLHRYAVNPVLQAGNRVKNR